VAPQQWLCTRDPSNFASLSCQDDVFRRFVEKRMTSSRASEGSGVHRYGTVLGKVRRLGSSQRAVEKNHSHCMPDELTAAVLTISDSSSQGVREDVSGPAVAKALEEASFSIVARGLVPDDESGIEQALIVYATKARLIVTTGGTGVAPRDVTPEATQAVCSRVLPGIAEKMRFEGSKKTPMAALSRGICGVRGHSLILNLPGSPTGAVDSLAAVIGLLPHALRLLGGDTRH